MIRILHLSDLHFGPHSRFEGEDHSAIATDFHRALRAAQDQFGIGRDINLVVVTGDIAETGIPNEFARAADFFKTLARALKIDHRYFIFVPGNHDVTRPLCVKAEMDQRIEKFDEAELRRRLDRTKLTFFDRFVRDFYGVRCLDDQAMPLGHGAYLYTFPEYRLSIAALNSCEIESHRTEDHRGYLGREQAQAVMDVWRTDEARSWLKVIAVHHNPTSPPTISNHQRWRDYLKDQTEFNEDLLACLEGDLMGFEGNDHLKAVVEDTSVHLVLHGHHHARDNQNWPWRSGGRAHVLSAGSVGLKENKLPGMEPASLRIIDLDTSKKEIRAFSLIYVNWARSRGQLSWGAFKLESSEPDGYRHSLELPRAFGECTAPTEIEPTEGPDPKTANFLQTFRRRFGAAYSRWELVPIGVPRQRDIDGLLITASLDDMYLPLRLASGLNVDQPSRGRILVPEDILAGTRPLMIRGGAGAGKTTWIRWTFRQLVSLDNALPIMIALRDLARYWKHHGPAGEKRSLDSFLLSWLEEHLRSGWEGEFMGLLGGRGRPRPILFVDGWDELGDLGKEFREKLLGFMAEFPTVMVVVTSRPFAVGGPSSSDRFETLDIQPLNDSEIADLARRFFIHACGHDKISARRRVERFLQTLGRSPDAQNIARNPLLLTIMLFVSRPGTLPEKRHILYGHCIENLLNAIPDFGTDEGVVQPRHHWRPDDTEERMREISTFAYKIQMKGFELPSRAPLYKDWDEAVAYLPENWTPGKKAGFLYWLVDRAGLLTDRSDDSVAFRHLSFQEYLAAWHLNANVDGDDQRRMAFLEYFENTNWWETLLLWAALIHRQSPGRLEPVLRLLKEEKDLGLSITGMMFADGLGTAKAFAEWLVQLSEMLRWSWPFGSRLLTRAWAGSRQEERKEEIAKRIVSRAPNASWQDWIRLRQFNEDAMLGADLPMPERRATARELIPLLNGGSIGPWGVAAGRILCGGLPIWPVQPAELALLQLWPGYRRYAGLQIQLAISCGAEPEDVLRVARTLLLKRDLSTEVDQWAVHVAADLDFPWAREWARNWAQELEHDWAPSSASDPDKESALYWARYWAHYWERNLSIHWDGALAEGLARDWARNLALVIPREWGYDLTRDSAREWNERWSAEINRYGSRYWTRDWGLDEYQRPAWVQAFVIARLSSAGQSAARPLLAGLEPTRSLSPLIRLFIRACQLSLCQELERQMFDQALVELEETCDPVWPALARHVVGEPTEEDYRLLADVAQHPEKVEKPLSWGLQFIVRGDVLFDDGSVMTLDQLADQLQVPKLSFVEEVERVPPSVSGPRAE